MKTENNKIKYFLYARKSSESEDRQVASIGSQIMELTKVAKRNGLKIIEVLSESQSAKAPGRPKFNQMLQRIHSGEAQGVICWKLDRLARNPVDGGNVSWMLQQGIIKHIQAYERGYFPTDNVLMMSVEFGMANQFILDLSQNAKRGLRTKAARGWYPGHTPVGYMHNFQKKKSEEEIIKDLERFSLVKKMFNLMLSGPHRPLKILEIANNEWGLRMPSGRPMGKSTIYRLFTNPFYCGTFEFPIGSGNWYKGNHEPMITEEEYDRIQFLLGRKGRPRPKSHVFAFTGIMRCGECGAMITAEEKIKKQKNGNIHRYIYYHCTKRKNPGCSQGSIEEKELKRQIVEKINGIAIPQSFFEWAMKQLHAENKEESEDRNKILSNQQKAYNGCVKEIDGLIGMRARGELDEENYKRRIKSLTQEKARLQELLNDTDNRVNGWVRKAEEYYLFARDAKEKFETGTLEERKQVLTSLGSNLSIKDRKLHILIEKPLIPIGKAAKEVRRIHHRLEPLEKGKNELNLDDFYSKSPILQGRQDSNLEQKFWRFL